jgi:hypothetical protein
VHVRKRPQSTGLRAIRVNGAESARRDASRARDVCNTTTAATAWITTAATGSLK